MTSELDHIQLSPLIVGEWYKDGLLLSPQTPSHNSPSRDSPSPAQPPAGPAPQPAAVKPAPAPPLQKPSTDAAPPLQKPAPDIPPPVQKPSPQSLTAPEPAAAPAGYKFLGKNGKKISILVQSPGIPFLPDNQLTFLTKILEACRMNIGDVAIVNTATAPVAIAELKQQLQPTAVLLFGLEPTAIKLPINFPEFKVQPYDNCSYLSAPALTRLVQQNEESKLLKSKLWVCLKTLFNV